MSVFNAEDTLTEAVDSVLSQSLDGLELICVDDGSTDGSLAILCEYEARDPRVRVITQWNIGGDTARNLGLEAARGEYVHFLEAADRVLPYAYECLYDKAEKHGLDVLRCAAVDWDVTRGCYVDRPGDSLSGLRPGDFGRLVGIEEGSPVHLAGAAPWAGLFRREFLLEHAIRFNDLPRADDRSFVDRAIASAGRMMFSRDRVVLHRVHGSDIGTDSPAADREVRVEHGPCGHPKVSVVVPVYNVEDYLNEAMESLINQTLEEMEFVCVDDGSTDGSPVILREYAALDGRIRILDGPNGGYGRAMNRGIDAARGEYLGILEPDDFVPYDMFGSLYRRARKAGADLVKADFYRFKTNPDGSLREERVRIVGGRRNLGYYNRVLCPVEEQKTFRFEMNTWSGIYRLDFLNRWHIRHNETPGASYQDNGFFFQTFCRAERALFVDKAFYCYREDNPDSSRNSRSKMYAITAEYRFIWEWLERDPELLEKVEGVFYQRKLNSFFFTLSRLDPSLRDEYVHHMHDEFEEPYRNGLIKEEDCFGVTDWSAFTQIMADPGEYLEHICVSVVMPVYNGERYLREALDGALSGNALQYEVICVDDGSTDATPEILAEYAARDPRVRVVRQENAGAGAARNAGMQLARGEYLSFLDADDLFEPGMLEKAYGRARAQDADIVVFRCDRYYVDIDIYKPTRWSLRRGLLPHKDVFSADEVRYSPYEAFMGWTWDKLFRTEFVRRNGFRFQEQRTTNDLLFTYASLERAGRITTMDDVLVHHRMHEGSLSTTREESWRCFYDALVALRQQLRDWGLFERREQDFVNYALSFSLWNLSTLSGDAYAGLYDALKHGWLEDLGVTGRPKGYFYNRDEYRQLQRLLVSEPEEFRSWLEGREGWKEPLRRAYHAALHLLKRG